MAKKSSTLRDHLRKIKDIRYETVTKQNFNLSVLNVGNQCLVCPGYRNN